MSANIIICLPTFCLVSRCPAVPAPRSLNYKTIPRKLVGKMTTFIELFKSFLFNKLVCLFNPNSSMQCNCLLFVEPSHHYLIAFKGPFKIYVSCQRGLGAVWHLTKADKGGAGGPLDAYNCLQGCEEVENADNSPEKNPMKWSLFFRDQGQHGQQWQQHERAFTQPLWNNWRWKPNPRGRGMFCPIVLSE